MHSLARTMANRLGLTTLLTVAPLISGATFCFATPPAAPTALPGARSVPSAQSPSHPNIIFILCDDLGYADLSCFGQKHFTTPNLDKMAAGGMRLTQHYAGAPVCAPSRASLLLGLDQGDCPVRDQQFDRAIPNTLTIASVLHQAGYRTLAIGKWGLGGFPKNGFPAHPQKRGFDAWYGLYTHADGHVHYPDAQHPLFDGYTDSTETVKDDYSTDLYTAKAKQWIVEQTRERPTQPFFLYLAYIAPHEAFNIPDGPYPAGGGLTGGVQMPLATHPATKNKWIYPEYAGATYRANDKPTNPELPWTWQMQHYATMVHRIDDAAGDLLQTLRDLRIDKNTLIVFTSDNGPAYDDGLHATQFESWGPLDGFKRDLFEGGDREPTIVYQPGTVPAGAVSALPSAQYDWLPTFAQLAGMAPPAGTDGRSLLPLITGRGAPEPRDYLYFEYRGGTRRVEDIGTLTRHQYTPLAGGDPWGEQQAVHMGDYVGIRVQITGAATPLRLYNIATDPHEDVDLSARPAYAPLLARMNRILLSSRIPQPGNARPYDTAPAPALPAPPVTRAGLSVNAYSGSWPWTPDVRYLKPTAHAIVADFSAPRIPGRPGAVEYSGYITAPETGSYTFDLQGAAGAHLWLDGAHLLDTEADFAAPRRTGAIPLAKGMHVLRLVAYFTDADPLDSLKLTWTPPGATAGRPVPASLLSHGSGKPDRKPESSNISRDKHTLCICVTNLQSPNAARHGNGNAQHARSAKGTFQWLIRLIWRN